MLKLAAADNKKSLNKSNRFHIVGGPYDSVEEAQNAAESTRLSLYYFAAQNKRGFNLGKYEPSGGLTSAGEEHFEKIYGAPVINDKLGITIFEAEPNPLFTRFDVRAKLSRSTDAFIQSLQKSFGKYTFLSDKADLSVELFSMSYFESSINARFLTLFMALEVLLERENRSNATNSLIYQFVDSAKKSALPDNEKNSLIRGLELLKEESIGQAARKNAGNLLGENRYLSLKPKQFFNKAYELRNELIHTGKIDDNKLREIISEFEKFVGDLLQNQFIHN